MDENPNSNTWAIFVRNWGDEGFCSSLNHEINLVDQKMTLLLPWPGAKALKAEVEQISPGAVPPAAGLLQDGQGKGEGALVTFTLPTLSKQGLVEVLLRFQWNGGKAIPGHVNTSGLSLATAAPRHASEGEQDAEQLLCGLKTQAGVSKPRVAATAAPSGFPAVSQPIKLKVQLYRRPLKTSAPVASLLGESLKPPVECGGPGSASPCPVDSAKRKRDIDLWKKICAGLKGNYSDQRIAQNCARIEKVP